MRNAPLLAVLLGAAAMRCAATQPSSKVDTS